MSSFYNGKSKMTRITKTTITITIILLLLLAMRIDLYATNMVDIYKATDTNDEICIYIGELESEPSIREIQIDGILVNDSIVCPLTDNPGDIKTLIMVDNSLSIVEKNREKIKDILIRIISDVEKGEQIRLSLFDEHINYITDYTTDKDTLVNAIDSIEYHNQDTYLTDALYEALSDFQKQNDGFNRVIIISDGVDDKPIGITESELYTCINDTAIQIYSIGVSTKSNNEMLKSMFALSRYTHGEEFLLDECDADVIGNSLERNNSQIYRIVLSLPSELKKGGNGNLQITLDSGIKLKKTVPLPFGEAREIEKEVVESKQEEEKPVVTPQITEQPEQMLPSPSPAEEPTTGFDVRLVILPFLIIAMVLCVMIIVKNKKKPGKVVQPYNNYDTYDSGTVIEPSIGYEEDKTQISDESDETVLSDNDKRGDVRHISVITLTRVDNAVESYSCRLDGKIYIGRKHSERGIVIDSDYSISKKHCILYFDGSKYVIQDLHSTNGTQVNGEEVRGSAEFRTGDIIQLGRISYSVSIE